MSWLGFGSQKEAIYALDNDGVGPKDIATRLGCKLQTVYARLSDKRKAARLAAGWDDDKKARARRIHDAAIKVIAEALGVTVDGLRAAVLDLPASAAIGATTPAVAVAPSDEPKILPPPGHREGEEAQDEDHPDMESRTGGSASPLQRTSEAAVPPPDSLQAEPQISSAAEEATPPPPAPVVVGVPKGQRTYGLKSMDGKWLTKDGRSFTSVPSEAWSGSAEQAKAVRQRASNARYCKAREFD